MTDNKPRLNWPRLGIITLLGMVSGLPLLLTGSTLTARLRVLGIDMHTIGFFAWIHIPYTFKFVWAPFLDRFRVPFLGRRRGWILLFQLLTVVGIALLGIFNPVGQLQTIAFVAVIVSFCAASLDIVIDAYRTEVLQPCERGAGGTLFTMGYRVAMLMAGAGVLIIADSQPWRTAYLMLAGVMLLSILVTFAAAPSPEVAGSPKTFRELAVGPFVDLRTRKYALGVLVFLLLYKLGETTANHLAQVFLLDIGFTLKAVGAINKGIGLPASIVGAMLGGIALTYVPLKRCLLIFGVLQAVPNLGYLLQHHAGVNHTMLAAVVSVDQLCNGMASAALVVFLMALCDKRFTAFQYAALSSLTSVLGRVVSGWSGVLQERVGWDAFFVVSAVATLPALVLLLWLPADAGLPQNQGTEAADPTNNPK